MRASRLALVAAVLAIPSAVYSQDSGLVGGRVGADLVSPMQPGSSLGSGHTGVPLKQALALALLGQSPPVRLCRKMFPSS